MLLIRNILIYHPAAIGDSVLATPVSAALKKYIPEAQITYLTHSTLFPLLRLCPTIDKFVAYNKKDSLWSIRKSIGALKSDLIVDLSGSSKSFLQTFLLTGKIVRYRKQPTSARPIQHAVNNFLDSIKDLNLPAYMPAFPTLQAADSDRERIEKSLPKGQKYYLAMVPGVGFARPNRAWITDNWNKLAKKILEDENTALLVIGGTEDKDICQQIAAQQASNRCLDLSGKLNLAETAAAFSLCSATISGDTGPAHISVAVGTPTISIHGPTYAERSGAFGMDEYWLQATDSCCCQNLKHCRLGSSTSSGACLDAITVDDVYAKLTSLLGSR